MVSEEVPYFRSGGARLDFEEYARFAGTWGGQWGVCHRAVSAHGGQGGAAWGGSDEGEAPRAGGGGPGAVGGGPHAAFWDGPDRSEVWDAPHIDRAEGFRPHLVDGRTLYRRAKAHWTIENQGFNDAKTRYGLKHLGHREANSGVVLWLLTAFATATERLYRLRYLYRGTHPVRAAIDVVRTLRMSLGEWGSRPQSPFRWPFEPPSCANSETDRHCCRRWFALDFCAIVVLTNPTIGASTPGVSFSETRGRGGSAGETPGGMGP